MKNEPISIVTVRSHGYVKVKLSELLDSRGITRNKLSKLTGAKYDVINRYYQADNISMVDLDLIAKICTVLNCEISDILEFVPAEK